MYLKIQETKDHIESIITGKPRYGIILGTGLSGLAQSIENPTRIAYQDIPNFPVSTVQSHKGELIYGTLAGKHVLAMAGRFHYYEGYSMQEVTFPIRVMKAMGVEGLIISNAAGGVNPNFDGGSIVFIEDHINMHPEHPLRGKNDNRLGDRFPDMMHAYDKEWLSLGESVAEELGIPTHRGTYLGLPGPNLETPAEYVFAHRIGADMIGMSTVPEVIVARHAQLKVLALSVISNVAYPIERLTETSVEDVIAMVQTVTPKMELLVKTIIGKME